MSAEGGSKLDLRLSITREVVSNFELELQLSKMSRLDLDRCLRQVAQVSRSDMERAEEQLQMQSY